MNDTGRWQYPALTGNKTRGGETHLEGEREGGAVRGGEAGEGGVCERRLK